MKDAKLEQQRKIQLEEEQDREKQTQYFMWFILKGVRHQDR